MNDKFFISVDNYINTYRRVLNFDPDSMKANVEGAINSHKKGSHGRGPVEYNNLINRWIESGRTDFSVYDDPYYIVDAWTSWRLYSRDYVLKIKNKYEDINKFFDMSSVKRILDLGAGHGYSSIALSRVFPEATVDATQFKNSHQYRMCKMLFKNNDKLGILHIRGGR